MASRLLAVARAGLTSGTLIVGLPVLAYGAEPFRENSELWYAIAVSVSAFPVVAIAFAAPSFRIAQYMLNGGISLLTFPIVVPRLYPPDFSEDPISHELGMAIVFSGPALLSLAGTTLIWVVIRQMRSG